MSEKERIIIIDGSGYIFRAYYAITRLSTSKGLPTNAVYGFVNMLMKVLEDEKPTKLAITFDTGKPTFRKEIFQAYKANRAAPPEDLVPQFDLIQRAVDCFGIPRLQLDGFEADDVIATVVDRAEKDGYRVEIITGDKDLMQLVNETTTIYDTMKGRRIGIAEVREKFQVGPDQVVDMLALMGDSSDNIPGVRGIGPKTAAELITQFGSLQGIYDRLSEIKQEKRRATLAEQRDMAFLSQKLATVRRDAPIDFSYDKMNYTGPLRDKLQAFFEELEFSGLLKRFGMEEKKEVLTGANYVTLSTLPALEAAVERLRKCPLVAVDTETTSLSIQNADTVGISLCGEPGTAYYVPVGHCAPGGSKELVVGNLAVDEARPALKRLLEDPLVPKVGQNLKYDSQILRRWGIDLKGIAADTLLESYLIDPDQPHNLDALALKYLGHANISYSDVAGSGKSQISFSEVTIEKATQYSAEDADVTLRLHHKLAPEVEKRGGSKLYQQVEVPLIEVLAEMEYYGVLVDEKALRRMSTELDSEMKAAELQIYHLAGESFNIQSPKQLSKILFEKLGLPVIKKTKTGVSTDESVLAELRDKHAICDTILKFREYGKLRSTYVEGLLAQMQPDTGRVHTNYNQTVAATGRLSSSNPNLQNIPIGVDPRFEIRSVFVAPPGSQILSCDYSQIELRLLADMSEDKELLRAFQNDEDVHSHTGRLIFGVQEISAEQRRVAKTINFGVVYGQTPYGLSQTLKISTGQAKQFIDRYFERYSGVTAYLRSLAESARRTGYAVTAMGRRRNIPEIGSQNRMRREMAERTAINMPLQGTAADLIKMAMVSIHRRIKQEGLRSRMIMQVHDELVFEVPDAEKTLMEALVKAEMSSAMPLKVPLKVDAGWGLNWQLAK
jgi:DNA polymerase I